MSRIVVTEFVSLDGVVEEMSAPATLTLADSKTDRDGVLLLTYHPPRHPPASPAQPPDPGRDAEPGILWFSAV